MNRDQFTRVVMLPQGDFAAFLRSKATDRLELLQSLFGTQRFEAVEQELARKAQAARTEVASLNNQLELLLARAEAETAALELDTAGAPDRDERRCRSWPGLRDSAASAAKERQVGCRGSRAAQGRTCGGTGRRGGPRGAPGQACRRGTAAVRRRVRRARPCREDRQARPAPQGRGARRPVAGGGTRRRGRGAGSPGHGRGGRGTADGGPQRPRTHRPRPPAPKPGPGTADAGSRGPAVGGAIVDGTALRSALGRLRSVRAVLEERLPEESRLAGLIARTSQLGAALEQLTADRRSGAAALDTLRTETAGLLAGLRPLEELAAEVQLRTKEAAAAEELVAMVGRHAAAEAACAGVAERHRARPGRAPGPAPALA